MSKKLEKSVCPICGKKFVKKAVNQKYCSAKCKRQASKSAPSPVKNGDKFKANGKKFACVNGGKKPVGKKITEKVALPKPPMKKPDVFVFVHGSDPYKRFALALQIAIHEFGNILAATHHFTPKKGK